MRRFLFDTCRNLYAGLRLSLFQRLPVREAYVISGDQLLALIVLTLVVGHLPDYFLSSPQAHFNFGAFTYWVTEQSLLVCLLYLLWRAFRVSAGFIDLLVVLYSTVLSDFALAWLNEGMLVQHEQESGFLGLGVLCWLYSLTLIFWQLYSVSARTVFAASYLLVLILFSVMQSVYFVNDHQFWRDDDVQTRTDEQDDDAFWQPYRQLDGEAVMYRQSALLEQSLRRLKPQQWQASELFFVGFAGYALQDVFMKEVQFAQEVMDRQFATQGHSLLLVNHLATNEQLPLASATNLAQTLQRIGQIMDKEQDILVLYLTSHGSDDHHVSINFWPLPLNDITPESLKQMLDRSGIKWRVVIVSACYSGGYVDALADPNTVVATAAAADRPSFGCSNQADFTYYGEALFKQQWQQKPLFLKGLSGAIELIGAREQAEGLEPSRPQLAVGAAIADKLAQWQRQSRALSRR